MGTVVTSCRRTVPLWDGARKESLSVNCPARWNVAREVMGMPAERYLFCRLKYLFCFNKGVSIYRFFFFLLQFG